MSVRLLICCCLAVLAAFVLHSTAAATVPRGRVALGGLCTNNGNCSAVPHSWCLDGRCGCADGYEVNGTTCTIKLNSPCNSTHLCNRTGAECLRGLCVCRADFFVSANGTHCLKPAVYLSDPCAYNQHCNAVLNTECRRGHCQCLENYFESSNRRGCERSYCHGTSCAHMGYSVCNNGICVCDYPNALQSENRCYKKIGTVEDRCNTDNNEICWLDDDGVDQNVECSSEGKCQCKKNYKPNESKKRCEREIDYFSLIFIVVVVVALFVWRRFFPKQHTNISVQSDEEVALKTKNF